MMAITHLVGESVGGSSATKMVPAMHAICSFMFGTHPIRTYIDKSGKPWFRAGDIATALGYTETTKPVNKFVPKTNKLTLADILTPAKMEGVLNLTSGDLSAIYIDEPGMQS